MPQTTKEAPAAVAPAKQAVRKPTRGRGRGGASGAGRGSSSAQVAATDPDFQQDDRGAENRSHRRGRGAGRGTRTGYDRHSRAAQYVCCWWGMDEKERNAANFFFTRTKARSVACRASIAVPPVSTALTRSLARAKRKRKEKRNRLEENARCPYLLSLSLFSPLRLYSFVLGGSFTARRANDCVPTFCMRPCADACCACCIVCASHLLLQCPNPFSGFSIWFLVSVCSSATTCISDAQRFSPKAGCGSCLV